MSADTFKDIPDLLPCKAVQNCSNGYGETVAPTASSDRVCRYCLVGLLCVVSIHALTISSFPD